MRHPVLTLTLLASMACSAAAQSPDSLSVIDRTATAIGAESRFWAPAFDNPALVQWKLPVSSSSLSLSWDHERQSRPVAAEAGDGSDFFAFTANAYIKHDSSTLWGDAAYRNGKTRSISWNETSDIDLVYPYFSADEVGGDMNTEQYSFAGGYADHRGRWAWGGTLSYLAGLHYRSVDPRPRNVTGRLDAAIGAALRAWSNQYVALSINARKYKQTNNIKFVSEMGSSIVYHTTGMGMDYSRFAGAGDNAYYTGYRYGATLDLYPASGSGPVASLGLSRFTFDKVLTDLNKLPLCSVWHNALNFKAGYASTGGADSWAAALSGQFYRRHGTENIFGDASTSIYPKIGSLVMYADNSRSLSLSGLWQHALADGPGMVAIEPELGYGHRQTLYADPRREAKADYAVARLTGRLTAPLRRVWLLTATAGVESVNPRSAELSMADTGASVTGLVDTAIADWEAATSRRIGWEASLSAARAINSRYALALEAGYSHSRYSGFATCQSFNLSLKFLF